VEGLAFGIQTLSGSSAEAINAWPSEGWYNPRRRHSALGRASPANFERNYVVHYGQESVRWRLAGR